MPFGHDMDKPVIAITLGDPGGVGPEVVVKALARSDVGDALRPFVVGDAEVLGRTADRLGLSLRFAVVESPEEAEESEAIPVFGEGAAGRENPGERPDYALGGVSPENGRAAHAWIVEAARLALARRVDAICTAPISKEAMFSAGFDLPGHTELLAELCGGRPVRMMLEGGGLRVALQTIHVALAAVPGLLSTESILETLHIAGEWGRRHVGREPRVAVCGLNPHAGEGGAFGREEQEIIRPAVQAAVQAGIDASGPYSADTVFHRAREGEFDLILAMYHDQALIPVKTLDFHGGVNVTLGLPIIRTSPDHGTGFDIAGRGAANESSMVCALLRAAELARLSV